MVSPTPGNRTGTPALAGIILQEKKDGVHSITRTHENVAFLVFVLTTYLNRNLET